MASKSVMHNKLYLGAVKCIVIQVGATADLNGRVFDIEHQISEYSQYNLTCIFTQNHQATQPLYIPAETADKRNRALAIIKTLGELGLDTNGTIAFDTDGWGACMAFELVDVIETFSKNIICALNSVSQVATETENILYLSYDTDAN